MNEMRTTLRKALICPYFGDQPEWIDRYWENAERLEGQGYDFLLDTNESDFRDRVRDKLGVVCPPMWGTGNIWDFRPALGALYEDEIKDFDFWGHTDFDCVYGRIEHFYPDSLLDGLDTISDHAYYFAGPWSLYRNVPEVTQAFRRSNEWKTVMSAPQPMGWSEFGYALMMQHSGLRCVFSQHHAYDQPELLLKDGEMLMHGGREIPFFHFRRSKKWPL